MAIRRSPAASLHLAISARDVTLSTPGVTLMDWASAVRLAASLRPAARTVAAPGPMKLRPAASRASYQGLILGHEAVAGEHRVVAVIAGDADDLRYTRFAFRAVRARVVGNAVHRRMIFQGSEFRRAGVRVRHRVPVRKQHAVTGDAHGLEHVHRLLSHRPATDDQRLEVGAVEALYPRGVSRRACGLRVAGCRASVKFPLRTRHGARGVVPHEQIHRFGQQPAQVGGP